MLALLLIYWRKELVHLSGDLTLPDQNPQLVNYLQGTWCDKVNANRCLAIKRDSIGETAGGKIIKSRSLRYQFAAAASKFFQADSSFSFKSSAANEPAHYAFRLLEIDPETRTERFDTIVAVSKTEMTLLLAGDTLRFKKIE